MLGLYLPIVILFITLHPMVHSLNGGHLIPDLKPDCTKLITVSQHDTCDSIRISEGLESIDSIYALNTDIHCDALKINQRICIQSNLNWTHCAKRYYVLEGDSCFGISKQFGIEFDEFKDINPHLQCSKEYIYKGQPCCVKKLYQKYPNDEKSLNEIIQVNETVSEINDSIDIPLEGINSTQINNDPISLTIDSSQPIQTNDIESQDINENNVSESIDQKNKASLKNKQNKQELKNQIKKETQQKKLLEKQRKQGLDKQKIENTKDQGSRNHPDSIRQVLDAHNKYRSYQGLSLLKWDKHLELTSAQHAKKLVLDHSSILIHSRGSFRENLYMGNNIKMAYAVENWYSEKNDLGDPTAKVGHYLNMMDRSIKRIGCAMYTLKSTVVVCRYV